MYASEVHVHSNTLLQFTCIQAHASETCIHTKATRRTLPHWLPFSIWRDVVRRIGTGIAQNRSDAISEKDKEMNYKSLIVCGVGAMRKWLLVPNHFKITVFPCFRIVEHWQKTTIVGTQNVGLLVRWTDQYYRQYHTHTIGNKPTNLHIYIYRYIYIYIYIYTRFDL